MDNDQEAAWLAFQENLGNRTVGEEALAERSFKAGWAALAQDDPTTTKLQRAIIALQQAIIALNQAIDAYWNDNERGLGLNGMSEHHMIRITDAQRRCR